MSWRQLLEELGNKHAGVVTFHVFLKGLYELYVGFRVHLLRFSLYKNYQNVS
jgi:hypothetical protein